MRLTIPLAFSVLIAIAARSDDWGASIARAESNYDVASAEALIEKMRAAEESGLPLVRAMLLLAELHRIDFEAIDESARAERRALGDAMDALADEALALLDAMPESAHQQRLMADLLAVKIRSKYKAKRFRKDMEHAAARALELDPRSVDAHVSVAKPLIFADEDHRGDIDRAVELLEAALEIDPNHEKARLLLAHADEQRGETDRAIARYERALEANPECRPARDALARLRKSGP